MNPIKRLGNRLALAVLRSLAVLKNLALRAWAFIAPAVIAIFRFLARFVALPIYRVALLLRMRLGQLALTARGLFFILFANRYILHGVLAALCLVTIFSQLRTQQATALDAGQRSLLYSLVTDGRESLVEETIHPELAMKDAHYLGSETLEAVPAIDFDYDSEILADLTVPGSIALLPGVEDPGTSGAAVCTPRNNVVTYTVQPGDAISTIAHQYCVTVGTVLWANNLTSRSLIRPGTALKILPVSGVLHTVKKGDTLGKIANTYGVKTTDEILAANRLPSENSLALGEELIIPNGTPPEPIRPIATRAPSNIRPDVPISRIRNKAVDLYQELSGKTDGRAKPEDLIEKPDAPKSKLLWPTKQRIINQYYGWSHTGVDIEGDYVDPIYASEDGVVETAGWNSGGYGLQIVVSHPNGVKTRYAHASKLFVKVGDEVKRGQTMAMVGTTGRSTGTHLHYEVYVGSKRVNPLSYTK